MTDSGSPDPSPANPPSASRTILRTCIATRKKLPQTQLLRVVLDPQNERRVIVDERRRLPGRGAWITPTLEAFELAEQRKAFGRALRVSAQVDTGQVRKYLADMQDKRPREQ